MKSVRTSVRLSARLSVRLFLVECSYIAMLTTAGESCKI